MTRNRGRKHSKLYLQSWNQLSPPGGGSGCAWIILRAWWMHQHSVEGLFLKACGLWAGDDAVAGVADVCPSPIQARPACFTEQSHGEKRDHRELQN